MKEYTIDIHAKRLVKMLQKKNPCGCCPAAPYYLSSKEPHKMWKNDPCEICQRFLGKRRWRAIINCKCPCLYYGGATATELTIKVLKKRGDL